MPHKCGICPPSASTGPIKIGPVDGAAVNPASINIYCNDPGGHYSISL